jgi:large subunit ribosomal protein L17
MNHQSGKVKLNLKPAHKRSLMRNQVIHFITYGKLITTKARAKEVQRLTERLVTIARQGNNFNTQRRIKAMLPYKAQAIKSLFTDIAPKYTQRAGGYTRLISLGRRTSDTAKLALLEWV